MKGKFQYLASPILGLAIVGVFGQGIAQAADHLNLEEGLPLEVEDAYPVPYQGRELQGVFKYERTEEGEDRFVIEPRIVIRFCS